VGCDAVAKGPNRVGFFANRGPAKPAGIIPHRLGRDPLSGFDDGQPYLRYVTERTDFSMQLPASEDYIIGVMPRAGTVVPFTLTVSIN
jgi:hypothetical protein